MWIGWCHVRLLWTCSPQVAVSESGGRLVAAIAADADETAGGASCPTGFENARYWKTCGQRTISRAERPESTTELAGSPGPFDSCLETSSQYTSPGRPTVRRLGAGQDNA